MFDPSPIEILPPGKEASIVANHILALSSIIISPLIIASGATKALELIFSIPF